MKADLPWTSFLFIADEMAKLNCREMNGDAKDASVWLMLLLLLVVFICHIVLVNTTLDSKFDLLYHLVWDNKRYTVNLIIWWRFLLFLSPFFFKIIFFNNSLRHTKSVYLAFKFYHTNSVHLDCNEVHLITVIPSTNKLLLRSERYGAN